jgi:hypothetical protein
MEKGGKIFLAGMTWHWSQPYSWDEWKRAEKYSWQE